VPTYDLSDEFRRNLGDLSPQQRDRFKRAVERFVEDLKGGRGFRRGLRVKRVRGMDGCLEMTWAPDGRAIFMYGDEIKPGETHIIWVAVGDHNILP
jgi:hypothetical protein